MRWADVAWHWTQRPPYVRIMTMGSQVRMTMAVLRVLREFLSDVDRPRYGYDLMRATGFPSGKLYPILARLADAGWLIREREDIDSVREGRPARFMYRLSEQGALSARHQLTAIWEELGPPAQAYLDLARDGTRS